MDSSLLFAGLTASLCFVVYAVRSIRQYRARAKLIAQHGCKPAPRYPHKEPLFGLDILLKHAKAFNNHRYTQQLQQDLDQYGATFQFASFGTEVILTKDPVNLQSIVSRDAESWGVQPLRYVPGKQFFGDSFFTMDGTPWKHGRGRTKPAMAKSEYSDLERLEFHLQRFFDHIPRDGSTVDIMRLTERLSQDFSSEYFFGESMNTLTSDPTLNHKELVNALSVAMNGVYKRIMLGKLASLVMPIDKKFTDACRFVRKFMDERIEKAFCNIKESKSVQKKDAGHVVFINELAKQTTDKDSIYSGIIAMYGAATDTTGVTISQILMLLSRNPKALAKLYDEVASIGPGKPEFATLQKLTYLRACMHETLRLLPIAITNQRTALRDTVLPTGGGPDGTSPIFVKKGTIAIIAYHAMHNDKRIWGADVEEFKPERFISEKPAPWTFQPFGAGPRVCPGQALAITNIQYTIARILQEFRDVQSRDDRPWMEDIKLAAANKHGVKIALIPA